MSRFRILDYPEGGEAICSDRKIDFPSAEGGGRYVFSAYEEEEKAARNAGERGRERSAPLEAGGETVQRLRSLGSKGERGGLRSTSRGGKVLLVKGKKPLASGRNVATSSLRKKGVLQSPNPTEGRKNRRSAGLGAPLLPTKKT